jgi:hypothetical protein
MSSSSHIVSAGGVHDFVNEWLGIIFGNYYLRNSHGMKDWRLLENMPLDGERDHAGNKEPSNVISFQVNRKTAPPVTQSNRHIYRRVNKLVVQHCIETALSLPGFYAFLREMTALGKEFPVAFENDSRLKNGSNNLISGYWEKVKPSLYDVALGQSDNMTADMSAANGIASITEQEANSEKSNQLSAQPPFKKAMNKIQQDYQHALSSRPTPTPTLTR